MSCFVVGLIQEETGYFYVQIVLRAQKKTIFFIKMGELGNQKKNNDL